MPPMAHTIAAEAEGNRTRAPRSKGGSGPTRRHEPCDATRASEATRRSSHAPERPTFSQQPVARHEAADQPREAFYSRFERERMPDRDQQQRDEISETVTLSATSDTRSRGVGAAVEDRLVGADRTFPPRQALVREVRFVAREAGEVATCPSCARRGSSAGSPACATACTIPLQLSRRAR